MGLESATAILVAHGFLTELPTPRLLTIGSREGVTKCHSVCVFSGWLFLRVSGLRYVRWKHCGGMSFRKSDSLQVIGCANVEELAGIGTA